MTRTAAIAEATKHWPEYQWDCAIPIPEDDGTLNAITGENGGQATSWIVLSCLNPDYAVSTNGAHSNLLRVIQRR